MIRKGSHVCLSDFHHMITVVFKEACLSDKRNKVIFCSYKNFEVSKFLCDISQALFHINNILDDVNDSYWLYETLRCCGGCPIFTS